jgi:hypothetical protein
MINSSWIDLFQYNCIVIFYTGKIYFFMIIIIIIIIKYDSTKNNNLLVIG